MSTTPNVHQGAKQAIIDAVQKNEQNKTNLPETIYNKSGNWVSPRKRKQENVNKISEQKTSKSKIEKQNKQEIGKFHN